MSIPPEVLGGLREEGLHLRGIAHVGRHPERRAAVALHRLDGRVDVQQVGDGDGRALARQRARDGQAEPAGGTGDDGDLAGEVHPAR